MTAPAPDREFHILAAPLDGAEAVQTILARASAPVTILDLSAGYVSNTRRLSDEVGRSLADANVEWVDGHDFAADLADTTRDAHVAWLASLADTPLQAGGPTLKEAFVYRTGDGHTLSMWWLTEASKRHPKSSPLSWVLYSLAVVERVVEGREGMWTVWSDDSSVGKAIAETVERGGAAAELAPTRTEKRESVTRRAARVVRSVGGNLAHIARSVRAFGRETPRTVPEGGDPRILIQTLWPDYWVRVDEGDPRPAPDAWAYDLYFGDLPWRLRDEGYEVAWMPAAHPGTLQQWGGLLDGQDLPDIREELRFRARDGARLAAASLRWLGQYLWWFHVRRVHREWTLRGVDLGEWVRRSYAEGVLRRFVPRAVLIDTQQSAVRSWKPDVVLHRNDFLHDGRILSAATAMVAPAVAVQHGLLNQHVGVYQYAPTEVGSSNGEQRDDVHYCPVPDRLAGFGQYTRDYFAQWEGYPPSRVDVVGGVRHDWLVRRYLHSGVTREEWRSQLGLPPGAFIVLLCASYAQEVGPWLTDVVEGTRLAGLEPFVAVKLHHGEGGSKNARDAARRLDLKDYAVFDDRFYELLRAADVMVAGASTTVLEAALFGVPVFSFAAGGYETFPFGPEGLCQQGRGSEDVADWLAGVRRGRVGPDEALVQRHLWNSDARAHRRLLDALRAEGMLPDRAGKPPRRLSDDARPRA